ncbi:MAG: FliO/MopB family protein [Gammaproteobacteria bacterium]
MNSMLMKMASIAILNVVYVPCSWSQDQLNDTSLGSYSWEAIKVILSLGIVLIAFYLLVNAFKKYSGVSIKANSSVHILGGISLGGKEKVVILQAGNVDFLLGVSGAGVNKLHQFEPGELDSHDEGQKNHISFNQQIEKILGKKSS